MDTPTRTIQGSLSIFQAGTFFPGKNLTFTFKDRKPINTQWLSIFYSEETGPLTTGGDFYNYYVLGLLPASYNPDVQWWPTLPVFNNTSSNNNSDDSIQEVPPANCSSSPSWCDASQGAYPDNPSIVQDDLAVNGGGVVTGYFLDDISTGVLSIPSFQQSGKNTNNFVDTVYSFITNATARNTSKIIIDLQHNHGGSVFLAINTFKNFYYALDPYAASRIRDHGLANILGDAYSSWWDSLEHDFDGNGGANGVNYGYYAASEWVVTNRINAQNGRNFSSWAEYAGPTLNKGDRFSLNQRYNLSDEVFDASAFDNWVPFGYGIGKTDDPPKSWAPEDVVILTDGICSSSCSLFVEMMTHQAGVRTIVAGGRPATGPMQAVSGSRGARVYSDDALNDDIDGLDLSVNNKTAYDLSPKDRNSGIWITYAGLNIADQMRENDDTPLQFKYQAADCRIYFTLNNVWNLTRLWRDAAAAVWTDPSLCVQNSTGYPTGRNTTTTNANSTTKPPPSRQAQTPGFDLDSVNSVSFIHNSTGGIQDGFDTRLKGEIVSCKSGNTCDDPNSKCQPIWVHCSAGTNGWQQHMACTPKCKTYDSKGNGAGNCLGASTFCDLDGPPESKVWGIQTTVSGNFAVYQGHCKPGVDTSLPKVCSSRI